MPKEPQMRLRRVLIANRGEIAVRIARAAAELGIECVGVCSEDDAAALHLRLVDEVRRLRGRGPSAYLDVPQLVAAARDAGCDAVHPGYGFLSERDDFASACEAAGLRFVGPAPETLARLGDKTAARELAARCGVPVPRGTPGAASLEDAARLLDSLGPGGALMVKAVAGGGGRGTRAVHAREALADAWSRCASEARAAFGRDALYAEELWPRARHVEVQIVGDGAAVRALGERDCTLQRRHQKLVEIAPAPGLDPALRDELLAAATKMAGELRYAGLGTFEFLVDRAAPGRFAFIEANARLQVEHTVTEAVTGVDLVAAQLELAAGRTLGELGLAPGESRPARGCAIELRVAAERLAGDGSLRPAGGVFEVFEMPSGPGVRVDTCAHVGFAPSASYDSLFAKLVVSGPDLAGTLARARRALREFRVEGAPTNLGFLRSLLAHPALAEWAVTTRFVDAELPALAAAAEAGDAPGPAAARAGARVDALDPLAVLVHGKSQPGAASRPEAPAPPRASAADAAVPEGRLAVRAPMQGTVVAVSVAAGDAVAAGAQLLVMSAMKMEHVIEAPAPGIVREVAVQEGDTVYEGSPLVLLEEGDVAGALRSETGAADPSRIRPDLAELERRQALTRDAARPAAVERRRKTGQRTARENVEDLCDPDSFVEYGALAIAAQRRRRTLEDLIEKTPADGLVAGIGRVNGALFGEAGSRCAVLAYDYTVLAGTQGLQNHRKKDRLFELAERWRLPVVFFTEGGGGRPGDTDGVGIAGLDCMAFHYFGRLSGLVPLVGINSGRCFAGNAALLGCCDVVIATANSSIGMGGPAMIEGGGLGVFHPDEVGPMSVQVPNGVVDLAVADEADAVRVAKQYLGYFQGPLATWECADQRLLRGLVPENRLRVYDVRQVVRTLADTGSVLELRRGFGHGMLTALVRIEGRPLGVVANDPTHLAGAIDRDGADKAARFLQLCDAFDLPVLFLCDTPGMMVGPEAEKTALVRHVSRLFVVGASLGVPFFTIVLRKGYGLGAQAMAGGSFKAPLFTVAWPTGEFGGMGLEGAVKLGYRKELAALEDPAARKALFDEMVARMYEHGKATSYATAFEIDDVIDPAESRGRILAALRAAPPPAPRTGKKRPCVDTW
jgi:acetyl/propionyl-CoA carboxylase alpha subunit/acetyl-CoA carboxylase carboxyltransferase component